MGWRAYSSLLQEMMLETCFTECCLRNEMRRPQNVYTNSRWQQIKPTAEKPEDKVSKLVKTNAWSCGTIVTRRQDVYQLCYLDKRIFLFSLTFSTRQRHKQKFLKPSDMDKTSDLDQIVFFKINSSLFNLLSLKSCKTKGEKFKCLYL